jgi:pimeloyl-ACP methyl ester carboxylesterase
MLLGDFMPLVRRIFKVMYWVLALIVTQALVFFLVVVPWGMSTIMTTNRFHFHDPNDGKTPRDFGMEYQPIEFQSSDGIGLKGWWLPASVSGSGVAAGTIVYVHGQNRTRIEMLPMAQFGHSLGYNGLVFDLRHAGASGGRVSSIGYWERFDVEAAIRCALGQKHAAKPLLVWGVSLGAASSLMAASETPDVAGIISDSTFLSFDDTARHHWHLFFPFLPSFPILNETVALIGWKAHFKPSEFDLRQAVERINPRPILFIGVQGDRRMPPEIARTLYGIATSSNKMLLIVPGTRHGEGFTSGHDQYEQAVKEFLAKVKAGS